MAQRTAIVSLHSHGDRSFLDDRLLADLSGHLRLAGHDNDLVVCVLDPSVALADDDGWHRLVQALGAYDVVVYERVWDRDVAQALMETLTGKTLVHCVGEHELPDPPAHFICRGELVAAMSGVLATLADPGKALPADAARLVDGAPHWGRPSLAKSPALARPFSPNLNPVVVTPDRVAGDRTFSVTGNAGCPYQADARDNPLYAGVEIPERYGRGCAFCTTGNDYTYAPPETTAARVLEQIRYVRGEAPHLRRIVLKDQNPFVYLPRLLEACRDEDLGGFALLLETRADWFLRSRERLEAALRVAAEAEVRIAPFLVGIESFSADELRRFNKGTTPETNEQFLAALRELAAEFPALDLSEASFGFIALTPWTTLDDLRANYDAVMRTGLYELRGRLLLSRARLYPDTALYYLARAQGLLEDEHASDRDDASRRYGYYPSAPWRFADPRTARFAEIATALAEETGGRDEARLWAVLLEAFADAAAEPTLERVRARLTVRPAATRGRRRRGLPDRLSAPEVFAFGIGLKPALRLRMPLADGEACAADLRARGADVVVAELGSEALLYVARHADGAASSLADAEARTLRPGAPDSACLDAHRSLGRGLGFPPCCIEAFVAKVARGVTVLADGSEAAEDFVAATAFAEAARLRHARLNVWPLDGASPLLSHVPCAADCQGSLDYATRVFGALHRATPSWAAGLRASLLRPVAIERDGRRVAPQLASASALPLRFRAF